MEADRMDRPLIVGAGLSGAVLARVLAEGGIPCLVIDERDHIAGNCHTEIDDATNILVHRYGPHIFHTDNDTVWEFVNRFASFRPYVNRVKAVVGAQVYSMPINLHTINQFFNRSMSPVEAQAFIASKAEKITEPGNFRDQALSMVGREIYEAFFAGYTRKQWGVEPEDLPASILKRLPLRFSYDDNYFFHKHQGIPEHGYTAMTKEILNHDKIEVHLRVPYSEEIKANAGHVFFTGALDQFFGYREGKLGYRTLEFEEIRSDADYQGVAVMNYCNADTPWTRIADHKYFAPWRLEKTRGSLAFKEYSRSWQEGDIRYYPLRLQNDTPTLKAYMDLARRAHGVTFLGRLGTYRYLDMDVAIAEALEVGTKALEAMRKLAVPASLYGPASA